MNNLREVALQYFGVLLPVERATLKAKFRQAAKALHTDTSGGDTGAMFIAMNLAYQELCATPGTFTDGPELATTEEGTPLTDLGNGLGPLKNGKICEECHGKGYHEHTGNYDKWTPGLPCGICQRCRSAFGCRTCHGRFKREIIYGSTYRICAPCQGTGEIEIFNPVIPKGLLAGLKLK